MYMYIMHEDLMIIEQRRKERVDAQHLKYMITTN